MLSFEELKESIAYVENPNFEEEQAEVNKLKSLLEEVEEFRSRLNTDSVAVRFLNNAWDKVNSYKIPEVVQAISDVELEEFYYKLEEIDRGITDLETNFMNTQRGE